MNEKEICRGLRHEFNKPALALLIYYGIMNVAVSLVAALDVLFAVVKGILTGSGLQPESMAEEITNQLLSNGWGYILAIVICGIILLIWKKPDFCFRQIWKREKPVTAGAFFALLCIFISGQALFQILASAMEWFFGLFDISIMDSIESATIDSESVSMFLYIALFAPVFEETLFRGLVLRSLLPYGKKFAILTSAFLFGIFHGNIVQSPYAFAVGLVLGYVAAEYSLFWSVVLHIINNFVLGEVMEILTKLMPPGAGDLIFAILIWGCALAAAVIFAVRRKEVAAYCKDGKIHPLCIKSFATSPAVLILTVIMTLNIVLTLLLQLWV